ncbi:MAG: thiamine pyrophosphate-binding protein [Candidatus Eremiobacteraeota bacterium]|nr:thiamine pyrophosphate-binding protein [Candidatus Eremiobacteraeota bacterium]
MNKQLTVAEYVIERLAALGITHAFGVPGDYAFPFDDAIEASPHMKWTGSSNELNAGYAADGYARIRGAAVLSTTYGVGELSALNAVMGSKAERLPVFHLVGAPSTRLQHDRLVTHHSLGDGAFGSFRALSEAAACAGTSLTPDNVTGEMERVIRAALINNQPAYITVPADFALMPVTGEPPAWRTLDEMKYMVSNDAELEAAVKAVLARLADAKAPVVLAACTVARYRLQDRLAAFLEKSRIGYATAPMDKATLSEKHPNFLGMYSGAGSAPHVRAAVEEADCVIDVGGVVMSDINTGMWSHRINPARLVHLLPDRVKVGEKLYGPVSLADMLTRLAAAVPAFTPAASPAGIPLLPMTGAPGDRITSAALYPRLQRFLSEGDIVFAETGSCVLTMGAMGLPDRAVYHNQTLWGSIGWATPAAFGASLAAPDRRTVLVTGDGSHQLTANEIGTMGRYGAKPVIIVLNNGLFGVEEVINRTVGHAYDDLALWSYHKLPEAMGCTGWYSARVETVGQFEEALAKAAAHDNASYIEVVLGADDLPAQFPAAVIDQLYRMDTPK